MSTEKHVAISRMDEAVESSQACCMLCIHWKRHPTGEQGALGDCYLNPPQPFPMPSQHPITGQMSVGLQMFRPITRDVDYCGYVELPGEAEEATNG